MLGNSLTWPVSGRTLIMRQLVLSYLAPMLSVSGGSAQQAGAAAQHVAGGAHLSGADAQRGWWGCSARLPPPLNLIGTAAQSTAVL